MATGFEQANNGHVSGDGSARDASIDVGKL
jgi:hypothetical protein